ncbi:Fic family protein [Microbulbifer aggregans]|uniref:Fic family protein n=1 Tax=Microbulbifer aggregans TaxID=1769779 RepID=UPI001CFD33A2|nr:Fic family protein [Microbulbifer aggregans]
MAVLIPPSPDPNALNTVVSDHSANAAEYLEWHSPLDAKGRYLHYDQVKRRLKAHLDPALIWSVIKSSRNRQLRSIISLGKPKQACRFFLSPTIQRAISETDRNTTLAHLEWMSAQIGELKHFEYLKNDLEEDEAISSSQLEGAATTTVAAKEMLKRKRKPRSIDERMILGNFKMMRFAWEKRREPLSLELILELHAIGTEGINDDEYFPGILRNTNDVRVVDGEGEVVHQPPPFEGLEERLGMLSDWANQSHHDAETKNYVHPLVKAIILHFAIGYEHPFRDGNGRVARSLFYWYMFKHEFAAFRYIAISVLLKSAPIKYGKSYLYTETDDMDLTYFIEYQCEVIIRAIAAFSSAFEHALLEIESFNKWLWESGLYRKLDQRQQMIFQIARARLATRFTAKSVMENLGCSYNTAAGTLNGLVELKLFSKKKDGRQWIYSLLPSEQIKAGWAE